MKTNPFAWSTGPIMANNDIWAGFTHEELEEIRQVAAEVKHRSAQARDLRTPKYKPRVVPDRKKQASKRACRNPRG